MKLKLIATFAVTSLAALSLFSLQSSSAAPKEKAGAEKAAVKTIPMPVFAGLKFGMSLEQIAKLNDKDLDTEFKKKFLAASPSQSLQVEEELRDKKAVFRRTRIEFVDTPTGIDQSALKGEYSYGNKESLARMPARTRDDGKEIPARHFFFFNDKLWKIYEEHKLGPKSNLGADFDAAVKKLSKVFGGEPQKAAADFQKGQSFDEAVWKGRREDHSRGRSGRHARVGVRRQEHSGEPAQAAHAPGRRPARAGQGRKGRDRQSPDASRSAQRRKEGGGRQEGRRAEKVASGCGQDPLGPFGDERAGRDRQVGARHGGGDQRLEHPSPGKRVAGAPRKAPCQVQGNPGIIDGNEVKLAAVRLDQGSQNLSHHADDLVLGSRHWEFRSYHALTLPKASFNSLGLR
jgi:hypothetical protein